MWSKTSLRVLEASWRVSRHFLQAASQAGYYIHSVVFFLALLLFLQSSTASRTGLWRSHQEMHQRVHHIKIFPSLTELSNEPRKCLKIFLLCYDKDNRAYSNSGWLADFGKHFCHPSSPFRHTSIRFADFYKHFCFGLHCCLHSGIQVFDSLSFVNIFALVTVVFLIAANHNVRNAHAVLMKRSYSVVGFRLTGWLNIVVFLPNVSVVI